MCRDCDLHVLGYSAHKECEELSLLSNLIQQAKVVHQNVFFILNSLNDNSERRF